MYMYRTVFEAAEQAVHVLLEVLMYECQTGVVLPGVCGSCFALVSKTINSFLLNKIQRGAID